MSSDFERMIRRDLDQLPMLPAERWVPSRRQPSPVASMARRSVAALAVLVLAVGAGVAIARVRADLLRPDDVATAPVRAGIADRQAALAAIRLRSSDVEAVSRIKAKLVRKDALVAAGPDLGFSQRLVAAMPGETAWVVAVSGEVRCSACTLPPPEPTHSAIYYLDPRSGQVFAARWWSAFWPTAFDALPDLSVAADSITVTARVVDLRLPDAIVVVTETAVAGLASGTRVELRADGGTAYAWEAGEAGGDASSLQQLVDERQLAAGVPVQVTFTGPPAPDGTYRLESVLTNPYSR
ncbi:MAG TPA: hypothetical protein VIN34_03370 [Candidatus Limnocylindria bacterium]|jgi:hypothetical protein